MIVYTLGQRWGILRQIDLQKMPIMAKKKIIFSDETQFELLIERIFVQKIEEKFNCHTAKASLDVLRPVFEDRFISRKGDVVWPTRGYDLTPLNYYLWSAVKNKC